MYAAVKPLSKYLQFKSVHIYDAVFTIHSKCTVALLLACTFLLSSKQYFGDPIQCMRDHNDMDFIHAYCWMYGAYVSTNITYTPDPFGHERCKPGGLGGTVPMAQRRYLRYYQWVVLVLLLQSFVFYLPAFLWKIWEGGRLKHLCMDFHQTAVSKERSKAHLGVLVKYFTSDYKETHFRYFASYVFCEVLNLGISILNMLLLDVFIEGFWTHYVDAFLAVYSGDWEMWSSITKRVFPKCAKCEVVRFGPSGSDSSMDTLCLLPLNILNEKIFAFLWVWFMAMTFLAGLKLFFRIITMFNSGIRFHILRARARLMPKSHLQRALQNCSFGDWFVLMRVGNNISPEMFLKLLEELYATQSQRKPPPGADEI
ncbi:innexin inx4 [Drosophila miranda]|uniref:innexin inx4 n=1 Tax=Drosophila miranda TaxID=7229 RepID=UPI0007E83E18|nr:innexin inx4 [Drosophila miranda]